MSVMVGSKITVEVTCEEDGGTFDTSSATLRQIILRTPQSSTKLAKTASPSGDDSEILTATIDPDENTEYGVWRGQPYVEIAGDPFYGSEISFTVKPNLD